MSDNEDRIVKGILDMAEKIFASMPVMLPPEWFTSDLTVAQLRILLLLHMRGSARMGAIASELNITLPTATGIVDNLVKKDFVVRETDEQDRRSVVCRLSPTGQAFIAMMWKMGQSQMKGLLNGLSIEQLEKALEVATILYDNVKSLPDTDRKD